MRNQLQEEYRAAQVAAATASTARMATRTLTSSIPGEEGTGEEGGEVKASAGVPVSSSRKKGTNSSIFLQHIEKTLSEENVREDFVDIVRDLEDRAISYAKNHVRCRQPSDYI